MEEIENKKVIQVILCELKDVKKKNKVKFSLLLTEKAVYKRRGNVYFEVKNVGKLIEEFE